MNRTGVWFSGHMAGKVGFFLGVPLGGPFFVCRGGGGVGGGSLEGGEGGLAVGSSLVGSLVPGALTLGVSGDVSTPSVARMGFVVLP